MIINKDFLKQKPIAEGREGIIYEYNNYVIKIFKEDVDKNEKLNKIKCLMSKSLPSNVVKPVELVYDSNNNFIGYMMNKIVGSEIKLLCNKKYCTINNITVKSILKMVIDIKNTLKSIHSQNIYISDLNERNILFDNNLNVYFIDVDSWTVDNFKSHVFMETFKDPLLVSNNFSDKTDNYAFTVLIFKLLTRIHPFGGTYNKSENMDIQERMEKKISIIDNPDIVIPINIVRDWTNMPPALIKEFKTIFEKNERGLIDISLEDFYKKLKLCSVHNDYYYSDYNECPVCNKNVKLIAETKKIIRTTSNVTISYISLFENSNVKYILDYSTYIDNQDMIIHRFSQNKVKYNKGYKYYYSEDGKILYTVSSSDFTITINSKNYVFNRLTKTDVVVKDNKVYYVDLNCNLIELTVTEKGNFSRFIAKTTYNSIFSISNDNNYFICNTYKGKKIINVSGQNIVINNDSKIVNSGVHFDSVSSRWLFVIENEKGVFETYVFDKNQIVYENKKIKFSVDLKNMCFNNNIIFRPSNKGIVGFSFEKDMVKEFNCDIVNDNSLLIKNSNCFIIINEKGIYEVK